MENDAFLQFVKKQDWKDFQSVSASGLLRLWTNKIKEEEEIEIKLKKKQSNHPWLNAKIKELKAIQINEEKFFDWKIEEIEE